MLNQLVEIRNIALDNYYLTECKQQLGLYNKAVRSLESYLQSQEYLDDIQKNGNSFVGELNPLKSDEIKLFKIKDNSEVNISDVDMYTVDYELDIYGV